MNSFQQTYIGKNHLFFPEIDSTNAYAMRLITNNNPTEGTAISAAYQSAGRGQIGRKWEGQAHQNVYTTVILCPSFLEIKQQFLLNQCIAVAIGQALESITGETISLKWPNDLYHNHKKLGGILIQNTVSGKIINYTAVGMGINVNQSQFGPSLPRATSLKNIVKKTMSIPLIQERVFGYIEHWYELLKANSFQKIKEAYINKLYKKDVNSTFYIKDKKVEGIIRGVDKNGKLMIQVGNDIHTYIHNEIQLKLN